MILDSNINDQPQETCERQDANKWLPVKRKIKLQFSIDKMKTDIYQKHGHKTFYRKLNYRI